MIWWLLPILLLISGCKTDPKEDPRVLKQRLTAASPRFPSKVRLHERDGSGEVLYLGMDMEPDKPKRGDLITLTHYFETKKAPAGDWDVFVHGETPEGGRVLVADHAPVFGRLPTSVWEGGEIWADTHKVLIPEDAPGPTLVLYAGLFKKDMRMTVEGPPGSHDGRNRIRAASILLPGAGSEELPVTTVKRAEGPVVADGKLDEAAWQTAEVLTFSDTMGRRIDTRYPTRLRLLYDDENLYVAFEATDADITERYNERDDPIYEHETVELFLMPHVRAPALGPYVELQASPGGVIFDASFTGRRQGMDKSFDAAQKVGTTIDGTLNQQDTDRGWVTEWVVPFSSLRWVKSPPKPGEEWRMNAFRIEKFREGDRQQGEYTAWSPPKVGDFHNTARFGRMKFGP